jgi:L-ascorbate metabolism protein UlaG (beta-lactamase superfamily)
VDFYICTADCIGKVSVGVAVVVRWLGHSSFQIRVHGKVLYIDLKTYGKVVETSEKADVILVTHNHGDHCSPPKIKRLAKKDTLIVAPKNCVSRIEGKTRTLKAGEKIAVNGIEVEAVEAYNVKRFRVPGKLWHPRGYGVGYLIRAEGKTVYHAGDTDLIPEMHRLGRVDLALLPTGDKYTMDNVEAAEAVKKIKPKAVMPMHTRHSDGEDFGKLVEAVSIAEVVLLSEGDEYSLK